MNNDLIPKYYDILQRTTEWHNLRLGKITGSSFHKLLSSPLVKKKYIYSKVNELILNSRSDQEGLQLTNIHINRGIEYESIARNAYIVQTFNHVKDIGLVQLGNYLACSPDGLVGDDGLIEIKVPDSHNYLQQKLEITADGIKAIPTAYYLQMQFNLYVCQRQWCDYVLYNPNYAILDKGLFIYRVEVDRKLKIEELVNESIEMIRSINNLYGGI